jgi:hypothetical protein
LHFHEDKLMKKLKFIVSMLLIAAFFFTGCDNVTDTCDCPEDGTDEAWVSADIQAQVYNQYCATSGCHNGTTQAAGLDLSSGNAYDNTVGADALGSSLKLIQPGDRSQSYLYLRISGAQGNIMPPTGDMSQTLVDSVGAWIDRGALQ